MKEDSKYVRHKNVVVLLTLYDELGVHRPLTVSSLPAQGSGSSSFVQ